MVKIIKLVLTIPEKCKNRIDFFDKRTIRGSVFHEDLTEYRNDEAGAVLGIIIKYAKKGRLWVLDHSTEKIFLFQIEGLK